MHLDLGQIFPVVDANSARLMKIKADCLLSAGVITPAQKAKVDGKIAKFENAVSASARPRNSENASSLAPIG